MALATANFKTYLLLLQVTEPTPGKFYPKWKLGCENLTKVMAPSDFKTPTKRVKRWLRCHFFEAVQEDVYRRRHGPELRSLLQLHQRASLGLGRANQRRKDVAKLIKAVVEQHDTRMDQLEFLLELSKAATFNGWSRPTIMKMLESSLNIAVDKDSSS